MAPRLHDAVKRGDTNAVRSLIYSRDPLEVTDATNYGRTALHVAVTYGQSGEPEIIKLLLEAGANIEAKDVYQDTPLHLAACYGVAGNIAQLLVDKHANRDALDYKRRTPLIWAASRDYNEIVTILLRAGARTDIRDINGATAADLAKGYSRELLATRPPPPPPPPPVRPSSPILPTPVRPPPVRPSSPILPTPARPSSPRPGAPKDIYTFIEGRHIKPTKLSDKFISDELWIEPFGKYLAETARASRPITLSALLESLESLTWLAYAVDEGLGLTFQSPRKNSRVRIVAVCTPGYKHPPGSSSGMADGKSLESKAFTVPTMAILAVPPFDKPNDINSDESILQVASFNPNSGWFNFYDRARAKGVERIWCYFGSSKDAYTPDTQGLGPFCGHANGTVVMREPEEPWLHWHKAASPLVVPRDHPLYKDRLHRDQRSDSGKWYFGEPKELATMIERGTKAWFVKRRSLDFGSQKAPKTIAERVHQWIAHVCLTTSIAVSSSKESSGGDFRIPSGFFFNAPALELVVTGMIDLEKEIHNVPWGNYEKAREDLGLVTVFKFGTGNDNDEVAMGSEGRVMWKVVTPSLEDSDGISHILQASLLPKKVLIAMLMVDFWNPVFSYRRAQLMRYIPSTATLDNRGTEGDKYKLGEDLVVVIRNAIRNLGLDRTTSPEAEFIKLMGIDDLPTFAKQEIRKYIGKVNQKLGSSDGVLGYMRLAETKRRLFRPAPRTQKPQHPLGEFDMMLPYASRMPEEQTWIMKQDATVENLQVPKKIWHPRNSQVHFVSAGCPFSASF